MKKLLIIAIAILLVYPYAKPYIKPYIDSYFNNSGSEDTKGSGAEKLAERLNRDLPKTQGLLTFQHYNASAGSIILNVEDHFNDHREITRSRATELINTWRPFVIAQVCQSSKLKEALEDNTVLGVYYQFLSGKSGIDYGKIPVTKELCNS